MHSFLGVPVTAGGAVFGNLYLTERSEGEFTAEDEEIATLLAAHAGVAIRMRLYAQAHERARRPSAARAPSLSRSTRRSSAAGLRIR
jgi:GAF domain-containing protein